MYMHIAAVDRLIVNSNSSNNDNNSMNMNNDDNNDNHNCNSNDRSQGPIGGPFYTVRYILYRYEQIWNEASHIYI